MKIYLRTTALLLALLLLFGCSGASLPGGDKRFPVSLPQLSQTLKAAPVRAVTLSPAMTENLYMLGYGGRLVGISDSCEPPRREHRSLIRCGSELLPNLPAILELAPDIVLSSTPLPTEAAKALTDAHITVAVLPYANTLDDAMTRWQTICTIFEGAGRAAECAAQLRFYADAMRQYLAQGVKNGLRQSEFESREAVLLARLPSVMATPDSWQGALLAELGFENAAADHTSWYYPVDDLAKLNPQYIILDAGVEQTALEESRYYKDTPALTDGQVYILDFRVLDRQSPRLFLALESLLGDMFPDAFDDLPRPNLTMPQPEPAPEEPKKAGWFSK